MSSEHGNLTLDVCARLKRLAEEIEESDGDKNHVMPVYTTRLRHNQLQYLAPELWAAFHRVMSRRALGVYVREMLSCINAVPSEHKAAGDKRQTEIIQEIHRIIVHDLKQPKSETVRLLSEYKQRVLSNTSSDIPNEELKTS